MSPPPGESSDWTLDDLDRRFDQYRETARTIEQKSADTVRGYDWAYSTFRKYLLGLGAAEGPLGERLLAIEAWVGWNVRRGLSGVSVNSLWRGLRPFFHDLEKRDGVPNPFRAMRPPVMPSIVPKARSPQELQQILLAAENYPWRTAYDRARAVAVMGVFIYAGLRKRELLHLTFADVDLAEHKILVWRGKGRGGGKDRIAYISPELRVLLLAFVRERQRAGVVAPGFFASPRGGGLLSESTLKRLALAVRRASGVPFSIHSLRHSFVTMLLRSGVPIHVVQNLAGHASIVTTAGYSRCWDEDLRQGVARLKLRR